MNEGGIPQGNKRAWWMSNKDTADKKSKAASGKAQSGAKGAPEIWGLVQSKLAETIEPEEFDKWIAGLRFVSEVDGRVLVAAQTRFVFDRVNAGHGRTIQNVWKALDPKGRTVSLRCWADVAPDVRELAGDPWQARPAEKPTKREVKTSDRAPIQDAEAMRFDTLVTGASNRIAATVTRSVAERRHQVPASIIVINGLQGVGKTHLMRALESELTEDAACKVAYISAEEFLVSYVDGAKAGDTRALKARVRGADIVLFDDLQNIAGKPGTNQELASTIRTMGNKGGIVVLTSDRPPADMQGLSPAVMTVLKGAACIEISMPDDEMRFQIVRQRADLLAQASPEFKLSDEMCREIITRIHGPGRDLCGAVVSLYTETGLGVVAPSMDMLERVLSRQQKPKAISIDMVKRAVCTVFEITKSDLQGSRKYQRFVRGRQIGMYLARELTNKSYPQIGISFGNRHHTTALYAWRKITKQLEELPETVAEVKRVKREIKSLQAGTNS